ncbi:hypothetical protein [Gorillibacterium sp. CAU 1737]|uniref:hypothetical protein n=1 Tax=Gorillibacterium sp. CAU 1737 TaxID=3140362 RepID=UPI00326037F7
MAGNTLDVYRAVKRKIENEFRVRELTVKTAGFKQDGLAETLSNSTGFWEEPQRVTSKPPRWIIQFEKNDEEVTANFAKKQDGALFPSAKTIGYINNREGNCSAMMFRIIAAIKTGEEQYEFPEWEWVMFLIFPRPLPSGNSSETIANFDPNDQSILYQRRTFKFSLLGIVKTDVENDSILLSNGEAITYLEASEALKKLLENGTEVENL